MTQGIYHLIIHLSKEESIEIGKLGRFQFEAGYYIYTGSAMNGLESRIARHKRKQKCLYWHIDYLLEYGQIIDVITHPTIERLECYFNRLIMSIPEARVPVKGFGSSDCQCPTHLIFFEKKPNIAGK